MGILDALGYKNPFVDTLDSNRNALIGFGTGLAGARTNPLGAATAGLAAGVPADQAYKDKQTAQATQDAQNNQTIKFLQAKGPEYAQLIPLVTAGQGGIALQQAFALDAQKAKQNDPSTVLDNQYKQAEITAMGNKPSPETFQTMTPAEVSAAGLPPGSYQKDSSGKLYPINAPVDASTLSPEALDLISTQYLAGDKSAISGYARNASMRAQIAEAVAAKASSMGMDGKAVAAEIGAYAGDLAAFRAGGTRAAQVGMAASEADQMADLAITASNAVPRGSFVPLNAAMNAVATGTSSPEMASFVTATTSLVNAYARAVSPLGAPTDAMRQHAEQMLNTAQGPDAYAAVIAQMKKEMEAALNAPAEISSRLKSSIAGGAPVDYKTKYGLD